MVTSFYDLPKKCQLDVFRRLDPESKKNASEVCRTWRSLILEYKWHRLETFILKNFVEIPSSDFPGFTMMQKLKLTEGILIGEVHTVDEDRKNFAAVIHKLNTLVKKEFLFLTEGEENLRSPENQQLKYLKNQSSVSESWDLDVRILQLTKEFIIKPFSICHYILHLFDKEDPKSFISQSIQFSRFLPEQLVVEANTLLNDEKKGLFPLFRNKIIKNLLLYVQAYLDEIMPQFSKQLSHFNDLRNSSLADKFSLALQNGKMPAVICGALHVCQVGPHLQQTCGNKGYIMALVPRKWWQQSSSNTSKKKVVGMTLDEKRALVKGDNLPYHLYYSIIDILKEVMQAEKRKIFPSSSCFD